MRVYLSYLFLLLSNTIVAQSAILRGKVTNNRREPLALVTIAFKNVPQGTVTKEDGSYSIELEEGSYDMIVTMIGYRSQTLRLVVQRKGTVQNLILEESDAENLSEVTVKGKLRDRAEEIIREVIRHKSQTQAAAGAYSCEVYIRAFEEMIGALKPPKKPLPDSLRRVMEARAILDRMAMAEVAIKLDRGVHGEIREEREGVKRRGNASSLFYLSTTEGDFNFYDNLIRVPSISQSAFLSPLSYSGLLAYRFRTVRTVTVEGRKIYTISIRGRQLSNATVDGEMDIMDSSWVVLRTRLRLPKYHLAAYDFFEVQQWYDRVNDKAWMLTRQEFRYNALSGKKISSGKTLVEYKSYRLQQPFERGHFGVEVSAASLQAYERDSSFWEERRTEPLTSREIRFIQYKDSVFRVTHSKAWLDSLDRVTNRITWQNLLYKGQEFNNHEKQWHWSVPALPGIYDPFQFGGSRLALNLFFSHTAKSRKNIVVFTDASYGLRNKDINGSINFNRMYNPFNRGTFNIRVARGFEYIFQGDAWINMIKRNNIYLDQRIGAGHGLELSNGLFIFTDLDMAFRRSVATYKTNDQVDSFFGDVLENNRAVAFDPYNAFYGSLRLEYTFRQRYIREPREKIILGSSWPTVYLLWRKGIPQLFNSAVDFNYLEFGLRQSVKIGIMGTSSYTLKTGSFLSKRDLRLVDYKYQRRGDPFLFLNPNEAFQSLDSTFPVFRQFYEAHLLHEFNGALLNKIPLLKKLGLREIAGAGLLYAPERNKLFYGEVFAGIERIFRYPFNQLGKFKLGVYVVGSAANQFRNPVQFKVGVTAWDKRKGKWF